MQDDMPHGSSAEDDAQILRDIRGHLTVAMLAAQHLHRNHPDANAVAHLFTHLHSAHQRLLKDIAGVEAMLERIHHESS